MEEKSNLWDIEAEALVTFERVSFKEEVTKQEAIELFKQSRFDHYNEMIENAILKIIDAEVY